MDIKKAINVNQKAIMQIGIDLEDIKKKIDRDMADQWKIISDLMKDLKKKKII